MIARNVAFRYLLGKSQIKTSCVISAGVFDKRPTLFKNRDRNYNPEINLIHKLIDGVEVAYFYDIGTGWVEGINEYGIGIVNSALLVGRDEAEKKIVNTVGKKSKDGARVLKALSKKTMDAAIKSLETFDGGIHGHTLVQDKTRLVSVESTSKHKVHITELDQDDLVVRTNHGFHYADAGYTEGDDYLSSVTRRNKYLKKIKTVTDPYQIAPSIFQMVKKDPESSLNIVRDTDNMYTSSQMVLLHDPVEIIVYLVKGKCSFEGIVNKLPKKHKPKIKISVFEYDSKGEPKKVTQKT